MFDLPKICLLSTQQKHLVLRRNIKKRSREPGNSRGVSSYFFSKDSLNQGRSVNAAVLGGSSKIHPNGSLSLLLCLLPFFTFFIGGKSKQAFVTVSMNALRSAELPHEWACSAQVLSVNRSWRDGRLLKHLETALRPLSITLFGDRHPREGVERMNSARIL